MLGGLLSCIWAKLAWAWPSPPPPSEKKAEAKPVWFEFDVTVDDSITEDDECPVCFEPIQQGAMTACKHTFCRTCLKQWASRSPECPICRHEL